MDTQDTIDTDSDEVRQLEEFSSERLDLAAWLVCHGHSLCRLEPPRDSSSKPYARFVFLRTEDLCEAVSTWESGQPISDTDLRRYISVKKDLYRRARRVVAGEETGR